jgi:UDP-N-acetylmuramoyl-L-alanyl-D-glutamate--2,6-diaminopimelate ligase
MKILADLLQGAEITEHSGSLDLLVASIHADSRKCRKGSLFFALPGVSGHGSSFIADAIANGAAAVVCAEIPASRPGGAAYIAVPDVQKQLCSCLNAWHGNPSEEISLVGVTGTNGKTTTASLLFRLFTELGHKCGLISTVENIIIDKAEEATHTTPGPVELYALIADMRNAGCSHVFMEVSSHAVHQNRIGGLKFKGGIFTNITRDHLDYHGSFAEYIKVKKTFFDSLSSSAFALSNDDDKNGAVMLQNTPAKKLTYSLRSMSDYTCRVIESHFDGTLLSICGTEVWVGFVGNFNAYNLLAVYSAAIELGAEPAGTLRALSTLKPVAGRFEVMRSPAGIYGIIDYAHTPDAVQNVLETISELRTGQQQILTVVGAGGDRDPGKRPMMAKIAAAFSDKIIITADNPRSEDPAAIARDMEAGVPQNDKHKMLTIIDREQAIRAAAMLAKPGDIILVAGKGHETYQIAKGVKIHFDDKEILADIFKSI